MAYPGEKQILDYLKKHSKSSLNQLSKECNLNIDSVRRAVESLKENSFLTVSKQSKESFSPTKELQNYLSKKEFPEFSVYKKSLQNAKISELSPVEKGIGLQWALKKSLVKIENGALKPLKNKEQAEKENFELVSLNLNSLSKEYLNEFLRRKLIEKQLSISYSVSITEKGLKGKIDEDSGTFSLDIETNDALIGKTHPLSRGIKKIKEIFVEMGFEEMEGEYVESTFWNFDSLFQPQDHPARELADTFYVDKSFELPRDKQLVSKVKNEHEKGWKYSWEEKEAKRAILRTHTTCLSAKSLYALKDPHKKYFSVARVFRNEETDFKHLGEFHQIEGIVAWEGATFRDLMGILKEFYKKMGFEKIRFRPSYFPYTEPSLEVEIYYEPKKEWMELGGAGIFRPEVTKPLTDIYPVLAWGLGLERILMLDLDLKDVRTFYRNDLDWLKSTRVKQ